MSYRVHLVLFRQSRLESSLEHPCRPNARTRLYSVKSLLPSSRRPETPFTPHPTRESEFSGLRGSSYRLTWADNRRPRSQRSPHVPALERPTRPPLQGDPAPLLLLGEGLTQLLLLLLWEVGGDDLEVILLELVDDPIRRGGPAGQGKQSRGPRRHFLAHLPDEIVVDPNVGHRTRQRSHPSPDRRA